LRIVERRARFALYSINRLVFITMVESVYSAVRTDSLCKSGVLKRLMDKVHKLYINPLCNCVIDMFLTSKFSSSGRLIQAVLWHFFHVERIIVHPTQYCAGDKINKNEMGWACGAYG
jgi:hypothetical protein